MGEHRESIVTSNIFHGITKQLMNLVSHTQGQVKVEANVMEMCGEKNLNKIPLLSSFPAQCR